MKYELLSKIYYKDYSNFEQEYLQRKNNFCSTSLEFTIHGNDAFFVMLPEFAIMTARLYKKLSQINQLCGSLPAAAYDFYARNCLIDEIIISNDIEGVRSTRKEILHVLDCNESNPKKKRFEGMVWKYVLLLGNNQYKISLQNSRDLRLLYDEIVLDEIAPSNYPDGEIFRKDLAEVISGTQKVKHRGLYPEASVISYIDKTLQLFERTDIPQLCKIAIFHYMIGYIHPFYDGNGRLSRFISSYFLREEFNTLIALRLSYTIKNRKSDYYKAFDVANDPHNMGDLTPFILYFYQVIEQAEDSLLERLQDGKETLDSYRKLLLRRYGKLDAVERKRTLDVLWYFVQNNLFSHEALDRQSLANLLQTSTVTAQHYIEKLIHSGVPIKTVKEGRKFIYTIDRNELDKCLRTET